MSLKNRIYELRKKSGLSQEQLADEVGVARQTISKWELGETAPNIEQARILSQIFDVSLDELLGSEFQETKNDIENIPKVEKVATTSKIKKIIALCVATIVFVLAIVGVGNVVNRSKILHPEGVSGNIVINRKQNLLIGNGNASTIVFCEDNKPMVVCNLPDGFVATEQSQGLYADANGNFIEFNANYAENVVNPLVDTDYYSYYVDKGYQSYMDMVRFAMYVDLKNIGVFSSNENIHLAGGARILRSQVCASQNADYYEIDGGLTKNGDKMRIYGFALHFDETTWLVTLKDCNDIYYFITVKAPDGVGKSIDTIGEFLSNISVAE